MSNKHQSNIKSYYKFILESSSFKKYFKLAFLLSFCIIEIIDLTLQKFLFNKDFSYLKNEYLLFFTLAFITFILIPLVSFNIISQIVNEAIFCCLLVCLFESFFLNEKNILRFCAFFILSQRTMSDIKILKVLKIQIFMIVLYPLIRYSIEKSSNLPQLFQYLLLLIANVLFSFKQPSQSYQADNKDCFLQQNSENKNIQTLKNNTNSSSLTQNIGNIYGIQAEDSYLNQTKLNQNSQIEFNGHINQYNISMNDEDRYPNSSIDVIQNQVLQENNNINQFLSEREIQLNKKQQKIIQSKTSVYENNIHTNPLYVKGFKHNLNFISSGIIILDQNKKLVYSNKQSTKIIQQKKNYFIIDEITQILSLELQNNKSLSQQLQKDEFSQQSINNQNKKIQSQKIAARLDMILQEQKLNRENEKNKISTEEQYKISQFMPKDNKSDSLKNYYNNQILDKYKYSIQIGENNQTQNSDDERKIARNLYSSNQNINLLQIKSENLSLSNLNNLKNSMNKSEKLLVLPTQSSFYFQEQLSDQMIQCYLPYNINEIFTKNNLKIDDILNFLIKSSVSPNSQEKNIENQIKFEDGNEKNNSNLSKQQNINEQKENNFIDYSDYKKQNSYLSIPIQQNSYNKNHQIDKDKTGNNVNDMKVKVLISDEEKTKILKKEKQQKEEIKNRYNYFIQNNYLHLTLSLEGDSIETQENKVVEIKLSVLININSDQKEKFIQFEISDITELKKQVGQENLEIYKNKILSSITHELRTPLNCSISMLDMLAQHEEIPVILKQVFVIPALNSNYLLLNIINDIIDLAQINYGKFSMQFSPFELNKIFTECINLISMQALQKNLEIELDLDSNIPQIINSDQNRIRQVLLNLLSNALKFTQQGKITIRASLIEQSLIQIDIEDTGCGIPEQNLMMIMKRFGKKDIYNFEDLKNKSQLNTMGVGMGLTIANNLAAGLGGNRKLQVSSIENVVNHPHNKIGCNFEENRIFGQELFKWKTISENSSNQQYQYQQLQQQTHIQFNILKENYNKKQNNNKLMRSQSMICLKINDTKQNEESISPLIENKFTKPLQLLFKFNSEVFQNQNVIQTHQNINSLYNQKQEPQNLTEGGKQKKYNLSFAEQTNCSFQESQIKQQIYSQYNSSIKTKSIQDKNNLNFQIFQDYFSFDNEGSQKTINKTIQQQRNFDKDKDSQMILEQQNSQIFLQDLVNQSKNLDLNKNSSRTSIEYKNQSSYNNFPNIKVKVQIPDKPNSDVQSNIILSELNSQNSLQNNNENRALKQSNIKMPQLQLNGDNKISIILKNEQCIYLFNSSQQSKDKDEINNKLQETKERQCEIINSNEVLNIQLPNQLEFQKVSEKRQIKI